jgi:hypothetical protein
VALEAHAEQIELLAFLPIGAGEDADERGRRFVGGEL